jgi:hypothetical protein
MPTHEPHPLDAAFFWGGAAGNLLIRPSLVEADGEFAETDPPISELLFRRQIAR